MVPLHAPDAEQEVAFVAVQVKVAEPPDVTEDAEVEMVTVGRGSAVTVAVVDCAEEPPAPVQVRV